MTASGHKSVLLDQAVDDLISRADGLYLDGTFGRGGHSRLILERLSPEGRLIGVDKDPEAIRVGRVLEESDGRFRMCQGSFAQLADFLGGDQADGILLDLGVSSPQLDDASRGFSFMNEGPLDMRMDPETPPSAAEWLNQAEERAIADVIWQFGEERFSRRIARAVVNRREEAPIETTSDLAELVASAVPRKEKHKHPATRTFQAIRIFINRELEDLDIGLQAASEKLAPGGRLVVISFHSLEDRRVKRFMRNLEQGPKLPRGLPVTEDFTRSEFRVVRKGLRAGKEEVDQNVRARSAVMRVLERRPEQKQEGHA